VTEVRKGWPRRWDGKGGRVKEGRESRAETRKRGSVRDGENMGKASKEGGARKKGVEVVKCE